MVLCDVWEGTCQPYGAPPQRVLQQSEPQDTLGEDSELATTFFRMADRIMVTEEPSTTADPQQVELSSVSVARAG